MTAVIGNNYRALRSAAVIASIIAAVLLGSGCGGGENNKGARADEAREFVTAADHFIKKADDKIQLALAGVQASFNRCDAIAGAGRKLPPEKAFIGLANIAGARAVVGDYAEFAARLRVLNAKDAVLRNAAGAVSTIARVYAELRRARPNYCNVVRKWAAADWSPSFSVLGAIGVQSQEFDDRGVARGPEIVRARGIVRLTAEHLEQAGIEPQEAKKFTVAAAIFFVIAEGRETA